MQINMDKIQIKNQYEEYKNEYKKLQKEIWVFVNKIKKNVGRRIDIVEVKQRPNNAIKSIKSILSNLQNPYKYKWYKNIFDVKDIAGIRVICHCEDDVEQITNLLQWEIKQKYILINTELKWENNSGKSDPSYKATHITLAKEINWHKLFCEVQIRTIMADARAVQDRKYIYGKVVEWESKEITTAAAQIMAGCEQLWTLVKKKNTEKATKPQERISQIVQLPPRTVIENDNNLDTRFQLNKEKASEWLKKIWIKTFMEIKTDILNSTLNIDIGELNNCAKNSTIETFGRPIGVHFDDEGKYSPKPDNYWIHAEISIISDDIWAYADGKKASYDYWAINKNGAFYLKKSLFEDSREPDQIFFNTRIVRITEVFMYIKNLYSSFRIEKNSDFKVTIEHGWLKWRILWSSSLRRSLSRERKIEVDTVSTTIITTLDEIETNIVDVVEKFTKPLFEQFEFFKLDRNVLEDIVKRYIWGEVV